MNSSETKPHIGCNFHHESPDNYTGIWLVDSVGTCSLCERSFCENHRSKIEPTGCVECFSETTLQQVPGVSPDSVHDGTNAGQTTGSGSEQDGLESESLSPEEIPSPARVFRPVGSAYVTTLGKISSLPDADLDRMIEEYKQLIEEAQKSLDYRRIVHSAANVEKGERRKRQTRKDMFHQVVQRTQDGGSSITIVQNPNYKPKQPKEAKAPVAPPINPALAALIAQLGPEKFAELMSKIKL